jgi:hypothetical protein
VTAPDFRRGFLRIPLGVWLEVYCRAPLTRRHLQLVSVVIRETWGWQRPGGAVYTWSRTLFPRHFAQATGLSTDHIRRDLRDLLARGVLEEQHGCYRFEADPGCGKEGSRYRRIRAPIRRNHPLRALKWRSRSGAYRQRKDSKETSPRPGVGSYPQVGITVPTSLPRRPRPRSIRRSPTAS